MHRLLRPLRPLVSLALCAATLVVPPLLLARLAGSPRRILVPLASVNWSQPDSTDLRAVLVAVLGALCWLSWVRLAAAVLVALVARLRGVSIPPLRLLGSSQALASLLVGGIAAMCVHPTPTAANSSTSLAVTVHPAGVEFAWADTAFLAAGGAVVAATTRRSRHRRRTASIAAGGGAATDAVARPTSVQPTPVVPTPGTQPSPFVAAAVPIASAPVGVVERHGIASVRALLDRAGSGEAAPPELVDRGGAEAPPPGEPAHVSAGAPFTTDVAANSTMVLAAVPDWAFMVRVLGPVDVLGRDGIAVGFERAKSVEFLAWVTLHRRSATREAARTALWETDVRDASFANVVSEARRALARHCVPDGHRDWLGRPHGELIPLHPGVVSDVDVFRVHVSRAETLRRHGADESSIAAELRDALDLVRGAPFIGSGFAWADAEASTSGCTLLVVNAALELGELDLAAGRIEEAFRAAGIGLSVLPGHEELVALRLRAHARNGDVVGIRHEWSAYLRSLASDPWQNEPSPWIDELVRQLVNEPVGAV